MPDNWTAFPIVPEDVELPDRFPAHEQLYTWKDTEGRLLGYTFRTTTRDGKAVLPFTFCHDGNGNKAWRKKRWPEPLPLYGQEDLKNATHVLIVEGEKCRDAARAILPRNICPITWVGGTNTIKKVDFSSIYGKKVCVWPDHDEPGYKSASGIARILSKNVPEAVKVVKPPQDMPLGWDIADAYLQDGWPKEKILNYIKENLITERELSQLIDDLGRRTHVKPTNTPFRCLGFNRGIYYYHPHATNQVFAVEAAKHGQNNLFAIAPKAWWESVFPTKLGIDWKASVDYCMRECEAVGIYDPTRIRGCGVWIDSGRTVVHNGKELDVDGSKISPFGMESQYLYEASVRKSINDDEPICLRQANKLIDIVESLRWDNKLHGYLLAGWLAVAPVCGALSWRPHILLTGEKGAGKTWVEDNIIIPIIGDTAVYATGKTSAAGIRQRLGSDAFPVVCDEFESKSAYVARNAQDVLDLMRQSSSDSNAMTLKGSPSGKSIQFQTRSCFCLAGIGVPMNEDADRGRISVLQLKRNDSDSRAQDFNCLKELVVSTLTKKYCSGLRARSIKNIKTILHNINIFTEAASVKLGTRRLGDQVGSMLGGAWSLIEDDPITIESAHDWMSAFDWGEQVETQEDRDEIRCLDTILNSSMNINSQNGKFEFTLGEMIGLLMKYEEGFGTEEVSSSRLPQREVDIILKRYGIRVDIEKNIFYVSNSNFQIKKLLKDTPWFQNWGYILRRIDGAEMSAGPVRFLYGARNRAVILPLSMVF